MNDIKIVDSLSAEDLYSLRECSGWKLLSIEQLESLCNLKDESEAKQIETAVLVLKEYGITKLGLWNEEFIDTYEEEGIPCYGIGSAVRYELARCIQFSIGFLKGQPPFGSSHRCVIGIIHDSELPITAEGQPPRCEYHLRFIPKPVSEDRQPYPVGISGIGLGSTLGCAPDVLDPNIECRLPTLG